MTVTGRTDFWKQINGEVYDAMCKIEMDEKGTRAAAVTAILMYECDSCEEPVVKELKEVYLDRQFAFLIYDSVNDKIVFMGKVVE